MDKLGTPLSEISFEEIKIGTKVVSKCTGCTGRVTGKLPIRREDREIEIDWDHGGYSCVWHFWCNNIIFICD